MLKFIDFICEKYDGSVDASIGSYISDLAENDDRVRELVANFTKEIDPSIEMSNAINILDDIKKVELLRNVEQHINNEKGNFNVSTRAASDHELNESQGKRGIFTSFLKSLTALGFRENQHSTDIPDRFLFIFRFSGKKGDDIMTIFKRFAYLDSVELDPERPTQLYFGLTDDNIIEYGWYYDELNKLGEFKLTKSEFNKLKIAEFKSLSGFKKLVSQLDHTDIILMLKLKKRMREFDPGKISSKMQPRINDRIITFGYYGYGTWKSGVLEQENITELKEKVKQFLLNDKWSEKFLMNVSSNNFWTYINFKIK